MRAFIMVAALSVCSNGFAQFRPPYRRADALPQAQSFASDQQQPHPQQAASTASSSTTQPAAPTASSTNTLPSLLNEPAQPAKVTLEAGKLKIDAHNSTLSGILNMISRNGGMKISGLESGKADQRVFGTYGPGTPREVLSELLNGSGYNVLMLGTTSSGLPRQLALSVRPGGGIPNPPPQSEARMRQEYEENQIRPTRYAPEPRPSTRPRDQQQGARPGIRTPQQILQELEQMRQRQQQEQQQQENQQ